MNPRTKTVTHPRKAQLKLVPATAVVPGFFGLGITQAIEMEKAMTALAVCMNSCAMDMCRHLLWFPFGFGSWFGAENEAVASLFDLQSYWLGLHKPLAEGSVARTIDDPEPSDEDVDYGIDVAASIFEDEILA